MAFVIVSRHPAAVEFARRAWPGVTDQPNVPVITGEARVRDVEGKIVVGNIPLCLASLAQEVWAIEFDGAAPRGAEYTVEEMRAAGARISKYKVTRAHEPSWSFGSVSDD